MIVYDDTDAISSARLLIVGDRIASATMSRDGLIRPTDSMLVKPE